MAAAIPFAVQGGAALYSYFKNKKNAKAQQEAQQSTQQSGQQLTAAAPPLLQQGQQLTGQGSGYLQQGANQLQGAGNYYRTILGSRSAATNSLAPETTTALNYYQGAENKANRTMRGGSRDYAVAELERQKVGQLASYLPAARQNAAQGMERVGSATGALGGQALNAGSAATGAGVNAAYAGGYLNQGAFNQAQTQRQNSSDSGSAWGKLFSGALSAYLNSRGGGGKAPLPSSSYATQLFKGNTLPAGGNLAGGY